MAQNPTLPKNRQCRFEKSDTSTANVKALSLGERVWVRERVPLTFLFSRGLHWPCVFRQWMRRAYLQFVENRVADALGVAPQMRIPEPQRLDTARLQKLFAFHVVFALVGETMLAAVQFNIQFRFFAKEIQIVAADGMLAAEFVAAETPVAQPAPDKFFRPRFILAKLAGAFDVGHDGNLGPADELGKLVI